MMIRFAVCLGLVCAAGVSVAATAAPGDDDAVIVTASRGAESLDNTLWSTTVITRADIQARQANSLQELLGDLAGINIVNNGGLGKVSSVLMRGAASDHTLLLIDGVRVASATAGTAPIELIPLEQIDRIEVVRGPRSTLYGTDAIGGVIQIFTRRPPQDGFNFGGSVTGGSRDTQKIAADLQARGEHAWINIGAEYFDTDGFNSCSRAALAAFAACFADEPDRDGYRNSSGSVSLGYRFNDDWTTELRSLAANGRTEFDGFQNSSDFDERVISLSLSGKLGNLWRTQLLLGQDTDNQKNFSSGIPLSTFDTKRYTAGVQLDGTLSPVFRLIAGADYQRDEVNSNTAFARDSRDSKGVFAELHGDLGKWSMLAGTRYEDNEQFGSRVTGNVGAGRKLGDRYRLTATWGTAFHAPTFNDLYYPPFPGDPFPTSNPNLKPEVSKSFELGLDGAERLALGTHTVPLHWSLHAFQTDIDQLIALDPNFTPININEARIRGAELQADWRNDVWRIGGQYSRLDPINRNDGDLLPRRAKQSASVDVRRLWPSLSIGAAARYEGRRFDDTANTIPLGGYVTMDLTAEQTIGQAFTVQARVANLFDRDYSTAAYYLQDGRNYSVTLRYRFASQR